MLHLSTTWAPSHHNFATISPNLATPHYHLTISSPVMTASSYISISRYVTPSSDHNLATFHCILLHIYIMLCLSTTWPPSCRTSSQSHHNFATFCCTLLQLYIMRYLSSSWPPSGHILWVLWLTTISPYLATPHYNLTTISLQSAAHCYNSTSSYTSPQLGHHLTTWSHHNLTPSH